MARNVSLGYQGSMPLVGLGTFRARGTENEAQVAQGCGNSHPFLTSKISPFEQGTEAATAACEGIISRLGWVDLLLIHWPGAAKVASDSPENAKLRHQTWRVLEQYQTEGRVGAIGVSNFEVSHLQRLLELADIRPSVNQIEVHPCYQQSELRDYCSREGIAVTAYASLGCGTLVTRQPVVQVAQECGKSPSQVLLRWGLQKGCAIIPKSVRPERIAEFSESKLFGWQLSPESMAVLNSMPQEPKLCWDPSSIT